MAEQEEIKTENFIQNLDISNYERNGSDVRNPRYSPLRLGKPLEEIDITYDYDFELLEATEKSLQGIDRHKTLKHIFDIVTNGAKSNTERHLRVLNFLQRSSFNNFIQPMYPNKKAVFDPLVLLELSEMRCGQVARVAVDLFAAAGIKGRLIQVKNHVLAELFYDGSWHYFDADLLGGSQTVFDAQGNIPSFVDLSNHPYEIDKIPYNNKPIVMELSQVSFSYPYPSSFYFNYDSSLSLYYEKTATVQEERNQIYGWDSYQTIVDKDRKIGHIKDFYMPSAVTFKGIQILADSSGKRILSLKWLPSEDIDRDILGYRVYISKHTRGWNYIRATNPKQLENFYNKQQLTWHPEMLDLLYQEPPHEVALIKTRQEEIDVPFKQSGTYYITIMPYDAHGESVGKAIYKPSEEIKIRV
ncbi:hypothetical protein [Tumidithrix helvetica]|uniref:hypothetical protein n=1 Tax=Tumidithrix helvetica TaxID=3457545 RepID=UPI003CC66BDC